MEKQDFLNKILKKSVVPTVACIDNVQAVGNIFKPGHV